MGKRVLISISCAAMALMFALRVRTDYMLETDFYVGHHSQQHQRQRRRLMHYRYKTDYGWKFDDPRTVETKDDTTPTSTNTYPSIMTPLQVCNRPAPIPHKNDLVISQKYSSCTLLHQQRPEDTTLLLLEGWNVFGRTGNNLIEFLHALQFAKDHASVVAIMQGSWAIHMITDLWMAIQNDDIHSWENFVEQAFCIKIIHSPEETEQYKDVIRMDTRDLFLYKHQATDLDEYVEFQSHHIRTLWRSYNTGSGVNIMRWPVKNMCSVLDAMFGSDNVEYSVIHSRQLEAVGEQLLQKHCFLAGCDPRAALDLEPDYIKAILEPLGMLDKPIVFITDHQRRGILTRLKGDRQIGPHIQLIPEGASWVGGDITLAVMAKVFIGNPASSFSGFIAKSRIALGFNNNFLFRRKNEVGQWVDVCDDRCIFDKAVMRSLA